MVCFMTEAKNQKHRHSRKYHPLWTQELLNALDAIRDYLPFALFFIATGRRSPPKLTNDMRRSGWSSTNKEYKHLREFDPHDTFELVAKLARSTQ